MLSIRISFYRGLVFSTLAFASLEADTLRAIPALSSPVIDEQQLLSAEEKLSLENMIRSMQPNLQAQVWIVKSLDGESIEGLSIRAVDQWKLGTQKKDNGLLILVAYEDRAMRIEVGQGLEGDITDAVAGRIIDYIMKPSFKEGQFYEGLLMSLAEAGTLAGAKVENIKLAPRSAHREKQELPFWLIILICFFLIPFIMRRSGFSRGYGSHGGSSGWGGGGGWSGGGGGFSGGGASGKW